MHFSRPANQPDYSLPLASQRSQWGQAGLSPVAETHMEQMGRHLPAEPAFWALPLYSTAPLQAAGSQMIKRELWTCVSEQVKGSLVLNLEVPTLRSQLYIVPP